MRASFTFESTESPRFVWFKVKFANGHRMVDYHPESDTHHLVTIYSDLLDDLGNVQQQILTYNSGNEHAGLADLARFAGPNAVEAYRRCLGSLTPGRNGNVTARGTIRIFDRDAGGTDQVAALRANWHEAIRALNEAVPARETTGPVTTELRDVQHISPDFIAQVERYGGTPNFIARLREPAPGFTIEQRGFFGRWKEIR